MWCSCVTVDINLWVYFFKLVGEAAELSPEVQIPLVGILRSTLFYSTVGLILKNEQSGSSVFLLFDQAVLYYTTLPCSVSCK